MANETRNFRSNYLVKVGIKGVEEKKSLEILLNEEPLDLEKIEQFCVRFPVPAIYRPFLWKLLLGLLPAHKESSDFVRKQFQQRYDDLQMALRVIRPYGSDAPTSLVHLQMALIERTMFPLDGKKLVAPLQDPDHQGALAVLQVVEEVVDDAVDGFWLSIRFTDLLHSHTHLLPNMVERVKELTKREDAALYTYLLQFTAFSLLPLSHWMEHGFAQVLPASTSQRIWDKVIGGCVPILVFTTVAIFLTLKRSLCNATTLDDLQQVITQIPEESGDLVATLAIELWQKTGTLVL